MSREAYQAPGSSTTTFGAPTTFQQPTIELIGAVTQYICGDCNCKVQLKKGDPIRCKDCGHRVLYKERTRRMVQFEAR